MEIHKVLKNGLENKIYTIIWKKKSRRIQINPQKWVLTFWKYQNSFSIIYFDPTWSLFFKWWYRFYFRPFLQYFMNVHIIKTNYIKLYQNLIFLFSIVLLSNGYILLIVFSTKPILNYTKSLKTITHCLVLKYILHIFFVIL